MDKLHVIAVISNPVRFGSRYRLYREFEKRMLADDHVVLHTVELAYGDRPFEITDDGNARHHRYRTSYELWHKENMINLGLRATPEDAGYLAWIDADVAFSRPDWALETVQQLQHHPIVQMFSHAIDLGPRGNPILQRQGLASAYLEGKDTTPPSRVAYPANSGNYHPGYAWAARRDFLNQVGGLMDLAIIGSGDYHMAYALIGMGPQTVPPYVTTPYENMILQWQDRALRSARKNLGVVDTLCTHYWHGKKVDRKYADRWKVLQDHTYEPYADVIHDSRGVLRLTGNKPELRRDLMAYFRARNEDSIDL